MKNDCRIEGDTTYIECQRKTGAVVEVPISTIDLPLAQAYPGRWCISRQYVCTTVRGRKVYLHHVITGRVGVNDEFEVDHLASVGTDNRRGMLQVLTHRQNTSKSKLGHKARNATGIRNVYLERNGKFRVQVGLVYLGRFDTIEIATERACNYRAIVNFTRLSGYVF